MIRFFLGQDFDLVNLNNTDKRQWSSQACRERAPSPEKTELPTESLLEKLELYPTH